MNKQLITKQALLTIGILGIILAVLLDPISQSEGYHHFSDQRSFFYISNFLNVISNIPFLLVGMIGVFKLKKIERFSYIHENRISYLLFYLGIIFVSFGSAYYHLSPTNDRLIWDRIPMTFAFMSLFAIILSEFISERLGKQVSIPLILAGIVSVSYWYISEKLNHGNLNYYVLVQFYPMISIPIILIIFPSKLNKSNAYWYLFVFYFLAKITEHFDDEIFSLLKLVSGHTLKHLFTSIGLFVVMYHFDKRRLLIYKSNKTC